MKGETPTFDEYRTGYISERWGVSDNCAKALQLFEIGFSVSGASSHLPVTQSTVKKYHRELMDTIHPNVVLTLTGSETKYDVWGDRDLSDYGDVGYDEGVADAKAAKDSPVTDRESQVDPKYKERVTPINRGIGIEEIPKALITVAPNVEVHQ